jgi:putative membrane protein
MASASSTAPLSDRSFFLFNGIISAVALAFLAWLLLAHDGTANGPDLRFMPGVNAALNGSAALLLIAAASPSRRATATCTSA